MASQDAIKQLNDESVELFKESLQSSDATWKQQVKGRITRSQLDVHGSQWQGRGRDQSQIVQESSSCQWKCSIKSRC